MNDIQFSEHLIEQDEIIDVKGITSHSVIGGLVEAYTLFLRHEIVLPSDGSVSGPYIYTDVITIPARFVAEESALGPNLRAAINRLKTGRKSIGYFIDRWDNNEAFDLYVDVHYFPSPFDSVKDTDIDLSSCQADIYESNKDERLNIRTTYIVQYRKGEVLATMSRDDASHHPLLTELDVVNVLSRVLQIVTATPTNESK